MNGGFTRGLVLGTSMGVSMRRMVDTDMLKGRNRRKAMKMGKSFMRKSGDIISDMAGIFR